MIKDVLKYKLFKVDQDTYYKMKTRPDGSKYYAYLVVYVDDILSIDVDPRIALDIIDSHFNLRTLILSAT